MNLVQRVQGILMAPVKEWGTIKTEKTPVQKLFLGYAVPLAAIPYVAMFLAWGVFSGWAMGRALGIAIVSYILSLALTYGVGFVINALAPNFGSKQNLENAMALAVYSMTPMWVAGILNIIPVWFFYSYLVPLISLYGLYILYQGFSSPMMDTPKDKQMAYFLITLVVVVVAYFLVRVIAWSIFVPRIARFYIP